MSLPEQHRRQADADARAQYRASWIGVGALGAVMAVLSAVAQVCS